MLFCRITAVLVFELNIPKTWFFVISNPIYSSEKFAMMIGNIDS